MKHLRNNSTSRGQPNSEWYTPGWIIERVRHAMGTIDLDPASSDIANRKIMARKIYTASDNGLDKVWGGAVFLNPPYSHPTTLRFMKKLVAEYQSGRVTQAITLTNAVIDTRWAQLLLSNAHSICLLKGRIKFENEHGKEGTPLQGQYLAYLGDNAETFNLAFEDVGICYDRTKRPTMGRYI